MYQQCLPENADNSRAYLYIYLHIYIYIYIYIYIIVLAILFLWIPFIPSRNLDEVFTYNHMSLISLRSRSRVKPALKVFMVLT